MSLQYQEAVQEQNSFLLMDPLSLNTKNWDTGLSQMLSLSEPEHHLCGVHFSITKCKKVLQEEKLYFMLSVNLNINLFGVGLVLLILGENFFSCRSPISVL